MNLKKYIIHLFILSIVVACNTSKDDVTLVQNKEELKAAIKSAKPGTTIALANGIWKDTEILFHAEGSALFWSQKAPQKRAPQSPT